MKKKVLFISSTGGHLNELLQLESLFKKYDYVPSVRLDVIDIDENSLKVAKKIIDLVGIPENFKINYICTNYLEYEIRDKYFLIESGVRFISVGLIPSWASCIFSFFLPFFT